MIISRKSAQASAKSDEAQHGLCKIRLALQRQAKGAGKIAFHPSWIVENPLLIFILALALYLLTLSPTVLWGDDAELQRRAVLLQWEAGPRDHPLYLLWAHVFTWLPVGDKAFRVNLCSAVSGALGVALTYILLRRLGADALSAGLGAGALAVSHAYWMHSVRAEVYTTYLFLFASFLLAGVRWLEARRPTVLGLTAFLLGLSAAVHPLALTALPALVLLFARAPSRRAVWMGLAGLLAGFGTAAGLHRLGQAGADWGASLIEMITGMIRGLAELPKRAVPSAGFALYQFPLSLPLVWPGWRLLWHRSRWAAGFLGVAWLGDVVFALLFRAPDQYVFFLPAYLIIALWVGCGVEWLRGRWRRTWHMAGAALLVPVLLYAGLPFALHALGWNPLGLRQLPYRDGNWFHLWPAKTAYWGPRQYGEAVMASLPAGAVVLADHTLRQNLLYFQQVEGRRPDVWVVEIYSGQGQQLPFIAGLLSERPVFTAAVDRYLDAEVKMAYCLRPMGLLYQVTPREGTDAYCP